MWWLFLSLTWTVVATHPISNGNGPENSTTEISETILGNLKVDDFLRHYGYLINVSEQLSTYKFYKRNALKTFQKFIGLNVTGLDNEETRLQILFLLCGMKGVEIKGPLIDTSIGKWYKKMITYKFKKDIKSPNEAMIRKVIIEAFDMWESITNLIFIKLESGTADIEIGFVQRYTPCPFFTDEMSEVYSHPSVPLEIYSGDIHFDDTEFDEEEDEDEENSGNGFNMLASVLHEIAYLLGLTQDYTITSVIYPILEET